MIATQETLTAKIDTHEIVTDAHAMIKSAFHGLAEGRASRQVVAAAIAAHTRTLAFPMAGDCYRGDMNDNIDKLVEARLEALRPVLSAQTRAGLATGLPQHAPPVSVSSDARTRANAARHVGFEHPLPISDLSTSTLKRLQRGGRRNLEGGLTVGNFTMFEDNATLEATIVLETLPPTMSESRGLDDLVGAEDTMSEGDAVVPQSATFVTESTLSKVLSKVASEIMKQQETCIRECLKPHSAWLIDLQNKLNELESTIVELRSNPSKPLVDHNPGTEPCNDKPKDRDIERQLSSPDLVDPAATVCKFYARGVCTRGASCRFAHISPQWSDEQPVVQQSPTREERQPDDSDDSFQDAMEQNEELALIGMSVRTLGLLNSPEYNDRFGVVLEFLPSSGRYRVQFDPETVRALKRANLQFPAICPQCEWEVTGSQCFNCGHGE